MGGPVFPRIHPTAVLAPGAVVVGNVTVGEDCFVGPNAVLRGDMEAITVGARSNIQDCCVLHTDTGFPCVLGEGVSLGHSAVVHGATLEDRVLIGMNAVVLNGARIGTRSVIGALSLVPAKFTVPPRSLAVGAPCRIVKQDDERVARMAFENAEHYLEHRRAYVAGKWGTVVGPVNWLPEVED